MYLIQGNNHDLCVCLCSLPGVRTVKEGMVEFFWIRSPPMGSRPSPTPSPGMAAG